jgi:hypothetical protein
MAKHNWHLSNFVAFIFLNLFFKIHLQQWFHQPFEQITKLSNLYKSRGVFLIRSLCGRNQLLFLVIYKLNRLGQE